MWEKVLDLTSVREMHGACDGNVVGLALTWTDSTVGPIEEGPFVGEGIVRFNDGLGDGAGDMMVPVMEMESDQMIGTTYLIIINIILVALITDVS